MTVLSHVLGFPRIGADRRMKKAVEAYWKGAIDRQELDAAARHIQEENWKMQQRAGLSFVTVGDFSWYDHVLDCSIMLGVVPERFRSGQAQNGKTDLNTMFCMARGIAPDTKEAPACAITKWFNTNYHYIVPELSENQTFSLDASHLLDAIDHAQSVGHHNLKPVILGPLTYLYLGKATQSQLTQCKLIDSLIVAYDQLLTQIEVKGVEWIQIDEPILGLDLIPEILILYQPVYEKIKQAKLKILIATYFCGLSKEGLDIVSHLPVDGLHVDLCACPEQLERVVDKWPFDRVLSLGLINGRNVWKVDLSSALDTLNSVDAEEQMDPEIRNWLAFAKQKSRELAWLAKGHNQGPNAIELHLAHNIEAIQSRKTSIRIHNSVVKERCENLPESYSKRQNTHAVRTHVQRTVLNLPMFPTTTIGSFPHTKEIRGIRHDLKNAKITNEEYLQKIRLQIDAVIKKQEEMELDVLVHGEAERNDMVEYFGELLEGYKFSQNGWVQSYGSRCVKPPIIFGDVHRPRPMTVEWSKYAQSMTNKPMKGQDCLAPI